MTNTFTLEDLDAAIEHEYSPLIFKAGQYEYVLQSLMRVDRKKREEVQLHLEALDAEDETKLSEEDALEAMRTVFRAVTKDNKGEWLCQALGDDLLRNMKLLQMWAKATQPGEATDSPN